MVPLLNRLLLRETINVTRDLDGLFFVRNCEYDDM